MFIEIVFGLFHLVVNAAIITAIVWLIISIKNDITTYKNEKDATNNISRLAKYALMIETGSLFIVMLLYAAYLEFMLT